MISSRDVKDAWRYSVKKDYTFPDGRVRAIELLPENATRVIPFENQYQRYRLAQSINSDGTILATASATEIKLYDLQDGSLMKKIKGHNANVKGLQFCPTQSNILVSASECVDGGHEGNNGAGNDIIVWDLDELDQRNGLASVDDICQLSRNTVDWISGQLHKEGFSLRLDSIQREEISANIDKLLSRYQTATLIDACRRIDGRLCECFHSNVFSDNGRKLIYLPGKEPCSNGDDQWDIVIRDLDDGTDMTLVGNRDAIIGVKYSPDGQVIVSIGWDGSFRLWDAATGAARRVWTTGRQNWAGVFSPDTRFFLGTDGVGVVRVWSVWSGELRWEWNYGQWCRAVDWSEDGKWIAVGGVGHARLVIFKVVDRDFAVQPELVHERLMGDDLDPEAMPNEKARSFLGHINEVDNVRFLPRTAGGSKVVSTCYLDKAVEVFDLESNTKWRIFHEDPGDEYEDRYAFHWLESGRCLVTVGKGSIRFWEMD